MKKGIGTAIALAGFLVGFEGALAASVDVVCGQNFTVHDGSDSLNAAYCGTLDLAFGDGAIDRAVLVIHGSSRNADDYMIYVDDAAFAAGGADLTTAVIAPQYLTDDDIAAHNLPNDQLYWSSGGWKKGNTSNSNPFNRPFNISSFAVLDAMIERLADDVAYPNLTEIVIAGHSAGGQFVHRYAASGKAPADLAQSRPDLAFRYIVANPSSYLYFSDERVVAGTTDTFAVPDATGCLEYDDYKYGLSGNFNGYISSVGVSTIRQRYQDRRVIAFLGEDDADPQDSSLDDSCSGNMQGPHRLARGEIFFNHAQDYFGTQILNHQSLETVVGVGHSGRQMFQSDCGMALLFDYDPNGDACLGGGGTGDNTGDDTGTGGNGNGGGKDKGGNAGGGGGGGGKGKKK